MCWTKLPPSKVSSEQTKKENKCTLMQWCCGRGGVGWEEAGLLEDVLQVSQGGRARKGIPGRGSSLSKGMEGRGAQPVQEWLTIR